jgi:uncharacterized protein (DUF433 family)
MNECQLSDILPLNGEPLPFRIEDGGAVRIGSSRVTLDLIVEQYENGMTPEDMVRAYDTLVLADVHAAIAYYLRHRDEVRVYLKQRQAEAATLRATIESEHPRVLPADIIARSTATEMTNAPTRQ